MDFHIPTGGDRIDVLPPDCLDVIENSNWACHRPYLWPDRCTFLRYMGRFPIGLWCHITFRQSGRITTTCTGWTIWTNYVSLLHREGQGFESLWGHLPIEIHLPTLSFSKRPALIEPVFTLNCQGLLVEAPLRSMWASHCKHTWWQESRKIVWEICSVIKKKPITAI